LVGLKINSRAIVKNFRKGYRVLLKRQQERAGQGPMGPPGPPGSGDSFFAGQFIMPGMQYPPKEGEDKKAAKDLEIAGIKIPSRLDFARKPLKRKEAEKELRSINMSYHLFPSKPKPGEEIFAYANIKWDNKQGEVIYHLIEPEITQGDKEIINKVRADLEERLNVDFTKLGFIKAKELLREEIEKSFVRIPDLILEETKKRVLIYYIEKEIVGFGKLDALMRDPNIEDVSCDGINIPIYVYHRNPKLGSLKTDIVFKDKDELDSFVIKLSQKCNKSISIAKPLLDGSLPDGSRIQATLGTDIARKGSNFTIRKFTEKPLTPTHMLKYKTLNSTQLAYLWMAIENGQSTLVSGGTATGKTAMLNVLTLFIRPNAKVVSIEDTAELRLPLPHWVPHVARTPISVEGKIGEVSLFDLLKTSLRQRPDYIIVGEVRGKEAYVLFQQIATGHTGLATIHAANFPQLIDRLITPPISLPPTLLENIGVIIFLVVTKIKGAYVRRADTIVEVVGMKDEKPMTNSVFKWKPTKDEFELGDKSVILKTIADRQGLTEENVKEELARRKKILEWMLKKGVYDYKDVARIISTYYSDPGRLLDVVTAERMEE
jgi:flagellar protein FlaI